MGKTRLRYKSFLFRSLGFSFSDRSTMARSLKHDLWTYRHSLPVNGVSDQELVEISVRVSIVLFTRLTTFTSRHLLLWARLIFHEGPFLALLRRHLELPTGHPGHGPPDPPYPSSLEFSDLQWNLGSAFLLETIGRTRQDTRALCKVVFGTFSPFNQHIDQRLDHLECDVCWKIFPQGSLSTHAARPICGPCLQDVQGCNARAAIDAENRARLHDELNPPDSRN